MRPLDGLRIADFTTLLPGPLATLLLAEAGAEVVKIERPDGGDGMRRYEPLWGEESVNFALLNRGKRSIVANLKDPAQVAHIKKFVAKCDILIEQFRPGVMDRLGLGYEAVSKLNPAVIYCSVSGYGQSGPKRHVAAHDLNLVGDAGLLAPTGLPSCNVIPPTFIADIVGGTYPAVINILMALRQRDATGQGCHLDIAMAENLFPLVYWALGERHVQGVQSCRRSLAAGNSPRYQLYETADNRMVAAAPIEQKFWDKFCDIIDLDPALRDDSADLAATIHAIQQIIKSKSSSYWSSAFVGHDCCCSIVATLDEAIADCQFKERGSFAHKLVNEQGDSQSALPVPIDPMFRGSFAETKSAPRLGEYGEAVPPLRMV
jgi:alpha-methylacyl-CoA racemase